MSRPRSQATTALDLPAFLKNTVIDLVRSDERDLSARQLGVFLICGTFPGPQTVRGLAHHLNVAKPAITRATDRLVTAGLVERRTDPSDRRSVHIVPTSAGDAYLRQLSSLLRKAAAMTEPRIVPQPERHARRRA
ncbi:MAG TPA: MarR family transcriptional regulator [Acetobacteraceae bacterium]|nr:MarR family transcriptional regulator [Acetobacteraceae bacterium]